MTQTVPDISPLMPMHQDPLLVFPLMQLLAYFLSWRSLHKFTWWRNQMQRFSALLALCKRNPPVTGGFPSQRPVTRRTFDVFFDLRTVGQTIEMLVIWDAIALIVMSYLGLLIAVFIFMMTSSNGNIFRVTGHLCGEFTGPRWIPRTKASDADLWWFLWSASE